MFGKLISQILKMKLTLVWTLNSELKVGFGFSLNLLARSEILEGQNRVSMSRMGFEPMPFRTSTWNWRLRPTRPSWQLLTNFMTFLIYNVVSFSFHYTSYQSVLSRFLFFSHENYNNLLEILQNDSILSYFRNWHCPFIFVKKMTFFPLFCKR